MLFCFSLYSMSPRMYYFYVRERTHTFYLVCKKSISLYVIRTINKTSRMYSRTAKFKVRQKTKLVKTLSHRNAFATSNCVVTCLWTLRRVRVNLRKFLTHALAPLFCFLSFYFYSRQSCFMQTFSFIALTWHLVKR